MESRKYLLVKGLFDDFKKNHPTSEFAKEIEYYKLYKKIIIGTLMSKSITNDKIYGLCKTVGHFSSYKNIEKYISKNIDDQSIKNEILEIANQFKGLSSQPGNKKEKEFSKTELNELKEILISALGIKNSVSSKELIKQHKTFISKFKYTETWLHYLNPEFFQINGYLHYINENKSSYEERLIDYENIKKIIPENNFEYFNIFLDEIVPIGIGKNKKQIGDLYKTTLSGIFESRWRCATSDYWEYFIENNIITLNYLDNKIDYSEISNYDKYDGKLSIKRWVKELKKEDLIIFMDKKYFYGVGISKGKYEFQKTNKLEEGVIKPSIAVEFIFSLKTPVEHNLKINAARPISFFALDGAGFSETEIYNFLERKYPESLNKIAEYYFIKNNMMKKQFKGSNSIPEINHSLNTILFGPPGTGKTYSTIETALKLLGETTAGAERSVLKQKFEDFQNLNRIYFTTFHQNVAYEDFIEGIKPVLGEEEDQDNLDDDVTFTSDDCKGGLKYAIEPGLFKKACAQSSYLCYLEFLKSKSQQNNYSFDDLYSGFIENIRPKIGTSENPSFETLNEKNKVNVKAINRNNSLIVRAVNSRAKTSAPLTKENFQKLYDKFEKAEEITSLKQIKETIKIGIRLTEFFALFKGIKEFEKTFTPPDSDDTESDIVEKLTEQEIIIKFETGVFSDAVKEFGKRTPPVVFIIDEINRGNVSSIFGELITLIESDKRWGEDEQLKLLLPYSKKHFFVPNNLYIIGTMNTADRSVEALDTALRRRFSFVPKLPEENKLDVTDDGIELPLMLAKINQRLKVLKDQDHTIGHAWFWNVSDLAGLRKVFSEKIFPLLQEYFYNDYEKLGLVLGDNFFKTKDQISSDIFAKFSGGNGIAGQYDQAWQYELKQASELSTADFQSLYQANTNSTDED